jgi:hypothetical protein
MLGAVSANCGRSSAAVHRLDRGVAEARETPQSTIQSRAILGVRRESPSATARGKMQDARRLELAEIAPAIQVYRRHSVANVNAAQRPVDREALERAVRARELPSQAA